MHVPWYFDDFPGIVENTFILDRSQSLLKLLTSSRGIANLTFALNYRFGGVDVFGFHLVNLLIHISTSCLIFLVLKRVFRHSVSLCLLAATVFLVHPLQTQAVTYIVQRMTSLSGLFFFLALYLYIRAREELDSADRASFRHWAFYIAALLFGAAAAFTKQNAAVLPVALYLFDRYFLPRERLNGRGRLLIYLLPFFLAPLWLGVRDVLLPAAAGAGLGELGHTQSLASQRYLTPLNYLVTEFSVVWLYIRLLFLPYGQALDYSYPLVERIVAWRNVFPLVGIVTLLGAAAIFRRKYPLLSFGIFWFFLTLAVESTIIPLDPVFEHRLYVPMFGFVLVVIGMFNPVRSRYVTGVLLFLLPLLAWLTWQRNALWNDPVVFYEDNLRRAPWSERVSLSLAKSYSDAGRAADALIVLNRAVELNARYDQIYVNLSRIYIEKGEYEQALAALQKGLAVKPGSEKLLDNLGVLYDMLGQSERAVQILKRAIEVAPRYPNAYLNLGVVYAGLGQWPEATNCYQKAIGLSYEHAAAHHNLGVAYYRQNQLPRAREEFRIALEQNPRDAEALFNLASVSLELGDVSLALEALPRLSALGSPLAKELEREIATHDQ